MAMTIELAESEMPRPLPLPTFSAPFAAPSLSWVCKKRLRCFHPAAAALRSSPDRVRSPSRFSDDVSPPRCTASVRPPLPPSSPSRPPHLPQRSPQLSNPPRDPTGIPASRNEEEAEPPDAPSGTHAVTAGARDEGGEVGWSLRSRARGIGHEEEDKGDKEKNKKKRKAELWVSLSRDEIEGDFLRMTGSKPPRRSRRRGKAASAHLLNIFPGSCLPKAVTADQYRVSGASDSRKG